MTRRPIIGVGAVVFKGDAVLIVRRAKEPAAASWSLPGGAQELGETTREAALRELAEETGISAEIVGLLDVVDYIERDGARPPRHHYTLVDYLCRWRSGEARAASDAEAVRWLGLAALDSVPLWSETRRVILLGAERLGLVGADRGR